MEPELEQVEAPSIRESLEAVVKGEPEEEPAAKEAKAEEPQPETEEPAKESKESTEDPGDETPEPEEPAEELEPLEPPTYWRKGHSEQFAALPRDVQELIVERDKDARRTFTEKTEEAARMRREAEQTSKQFEGLTQAVEPDYLRQALLTDGVDLPTYFGRLTNMDRMYRENPTQAILTLMQTAGITPEQLTNSASPNGQAADPQVSMLMQRQQQLEAQWKQQHEVAVKQQEQAALAEIKAFTDEQDANGKLLRPYLQEPEVINRFVVQVEAARKASPNAAARQVLNEAYEATVYGDSKLREQVLKQEREKQKAEETARARAAREKAGSSIKASTSTPKPDAQPTSIRENLKRVVYGEQR